MGKARWFFVVLFCLSLSHLNAQSAASLMPVYSPWAKWCFDYPKGTKNCFTSRSGSNICGMAVSVSVKKQNHEQTAILSVSFPIRASAGQKFRSPSIKAPHRTSDQKLPRL